MRKNFQNYYFYSSLFFAVAFITVLTVKLIFAWNPPTAGAPNPAGQTLYSDSSNNIGIGTLYPGAKLEVYSTSSDSVFKLSRQSATSTLFKLGTDSALIINNNNSDVLTIKNGNVGIGTTNPNAKLTVEGEISVKELSSAPSESSGYGKIYATPTIRGNDAYTKLLLHANDTGNSFIDSSSGNKSITAYGNATQSSTQSKFGGKSAYFDGTGDYLSLADSEDWNFGSGDFTIDFWTRFNATNTYYAFTGQRGLSYNSDFSHETAYKGTNELFIRLGYGAAADYANFSWTPSANVWYHIAFTKSGSNVRVFVDGTQVGTTASNFTNTYNNSTLPLLVALDEVSSSDFFAGYLDEFRISKGIARWTSNFTPPTSAYSRTGLFFKTSSGEEIEL